MRLARFAPLFLIVANCKHPPATSGAPAALPSASVATAPEASADAEPHTKPRAQAPVEDEASEASLATMRASFRQAAAAEATDPARAVTLYDAAYAAVPSLAAMLGEARAAKAKGDEALARRSLARALAFAERTTDKPRVRVSVPVGHDGTPRVLDVENDSAILAMDDDALLARLDFATGALTPLVGLPGSPTIYAASPHLAIVKVLGRTSVLELGVDDATTAEPLAGVQYISAGAISPDEKLLGLTVDSGIAVIDARTRKTVGLVSIPSSPLAVVGFTKSGKRLVVTLSDRVCVVSAPAWNACAPSPLLRGVAWPGLTAVGGELVAFTPNDTTFRIFDTEVGRPIVSLTGHFASVSSLALTPDGATLISSSYSRTVAWDVATHARHPLDTDSTESHSFEPRFSPDGRHAVETTSNGALVRDVSAMSVWTPLVSAGWSPLSASPPIVTFPAADHLWVGGNHFVASLDLGTKKLRTYPIYGRVAVFSVTTDESRFAVVDAYGNMGANLYAYDASGKRLLSTYGGTMVSGVRIDGDHVLVNAPGYVETVDIATGSRTPGLLAAGPWPGSTATSPDKKLHVTANGDGTLAVTGFKGGGASIEIGADAWAATQNGKTAVFGNRATARCNVGAAWLPLDACAALLGAVSL